MNSPYGTERQYTIDPGCPWYESQQSYGPPNVNWCEPTTCSLINEPINTWTNLGLILVGVFILFRFRSYLGRFFGGTVFTMGVLSFIYHATNNFLTQYIDFLGMFLVMSFLFAGTLLRFFKASQGSFFTWYWFVFSAHCVLFMVFHIIETPVQYIMYLNLGPIILLELLIFLRTRKFNHQKFFFLGVGLTIIAQIIAITDIQRIYCDPNGWIHGHALWHLIGAPAAYFFALHYENHFIHSKSNWV